MPRIAPVGSDNMRSGWIVAQLGARMHYAVPRIFAETGSLAIFYTDICVSARIDALIPKRFKRLLPGAVQRLLGRTPGRTVDMKTVMLPLFGLRYAFLIKRAGTVSAQSEVYLWAGNRFGDRVVAAGLGNARGVYAFNGAALEIFREAKLRGIRCVLEQTIAAKWKHLLLSERCKWPNWFDDSTLVDDIEAAVDERELAEWQLADMIVCASEFVKMSIASCGGPVERCIVIPYGIPDSFDWREPRRQEGPLRVLTVGQVGPRKGSQYVLSAAKQLKGAAVFRMVGAIDVNEKIEAELRQHVELFGVVPRYAISEQYRWADVFLLPSICEGSATVTYEALACGVPVICTPNTGSVVRHGYNGYIVPAQDTHVIVSTLSKLVSDRELVRQLSIACRTSVTDISFGRYKQKLLACLNETVS